MEMGKEKEKGKRRQVEEARYVIKYSNNTITVCNTEPLEHRPITDQSTSVAP